MSTITPPPAKVDQPRPRITPRSTITSQDKRAQTSIRIPPRSNGKTNGKTHQITQRGNKINQLGSQTLTTVRPGIAVKQIGRRKKGQPALPGGGGQIGNQNYFKGKLVKQAIMNALQKRSPSARLEALEKVADKLIKMSLGGSVPATRELFDRIDGKVAQVLIGDPENPLVFKNVSEMSDEELEVVARGHVINGTAERVD